ncbi:2-dehydro-3-deoxy-6-phosphogalactonate aldolase [Dyella nitratireducens]|uniref:2-dehydro-3-deoxy-6-phosphogalactonate aldolase n=1 Tax=Dyella nitratireducens TaxID=1849580 RepID=A0ABQ1FQ04_9GAMM|nr:2-dehydro-3-deoxy-6-phosphogalactonate aldolase [Dyella nitratireducens]GGA25970.1 2-dehydro-3-deoxy-6-phosphogalactonate aldolase [Dyella nitratireducens]GLQ43611.1 2-dehydro-3-deoxy-6-phosphogalactonate aldolase [Dyella nitratireducens]
MIRAWLDSLPLVAILRGIRPEEALAVGHALVDAGFRVIEVPLNSPQPMDSIRLLSEALGERCLIGAGTVLQPEQVTEVAVAGGKLIVMPHADTRVITAAKRAGLYCVPGVATPTEAFAAIQAGADAIKLFPAELLTPPILKAWRAVMPRDLPMLPVGGITPENMAPYIAAGANGFGLGSALYAPGRDANDVGRRAHAFAQAWKTNSQGNPA